MSKYKRFKRLGITWARPWTEDDGVLIKGVSVSIGDTPGPGGLIAINPEDPNDQWYIAPEYAEKNLEEIKCN